MKTAILLIVATLFATTSVSSAQKKAKPTEGKQAVPTCDSVWKANATGRNVAGYVNAQRAQGLCK
jgi:hypothetical protein